MSITMRVTEDITFIGPDGVTPEVLARGRIVAPTRARSCGTGAFATLTATFGGGVMVWSQLGEWMTGGSDVVPDFGPPVDPKRARPAQETEAYTLARSVYLGRFAWQMQAAGIDIEDGWPIVLCGLITRARSGRSRWDPARGGLSTWLYVAMRGIVINAIDKETRYRRRSGELGEGEDVASVAVAPDASEDQEDVPVVPVARSAVVRIASGVVRRARVTSV